MKLSSLWDWKSKNNQVAKIITVTLMIFCIFGNAGIGQTLTNNNALITISSDTRVTVLGGGLNNGDITNNGILSISGDWMNADTYAPGSGLLIFDGINDQNIAHNGGQVYQLQIDGGGQKHITGTLEVLDTLNLIDGHVVTSNGAFLLIQSSGEVQGGSNLSYIDGVLYHQGTGSKYFPVGTNGNFSPAELTNVAGANPVVGISVNEPNDNPIVPLLLLSVSHTRYWQLEQRSGVYDGSQIRLKVSADEQLDPDVDIADIVVSVSDSIGGQFNSIGQSTFSGLAQDGEVTSAQLANSEFYAIAVEGFAEERGLYVPNALSPAAPNPEDQVVKVYGQQIADEDFAFRIYNRWGQVVFETDSFAVANGVGWYGEPVSAEQESLGVYHYTLTGKFVSGRSFKRQGTITVIR